MKKLAVIVPCYNEEAVIEESYRRTKEVLVKMCIRDRNGSFGLSPKGKRMRECLVGFQYTVSIISVSYTHLDVYKRQVPGSVVRSYLRNSQSSSYLCIIARPVESYKFPLRYRSWGRSSERSKKVRCLLYLICTCGHIPYRI